MIRNFQTASSSQTVMVMAKDFTWSHSECDKNVTNIKFASCHHDPTVWNMLFLTMNGLWTVLKYKPVQPNWTSYVLCKSNKPTVQCVCVRVFQVTTLNRLTCSHYWAIDRLNEVLWIMSPLSDSFNHHKLLRLVFEFQQTIHSGSVS